VLYLAPWIDYGGSDKGTLDLFKWLDRDRFRISLVTTQPSPNRRLTDLAQYAEEVWPLPDLMPGDAFPQFILEFIQSRSISVLHIMNSRLAYNLLPDLLSLRKPPIVVVQLHVEEEDRSGYVRYVTTRYGNLVDAFSVTSHQLAEAITSSYGIPRTKCHVIYTGVDADGEFSPARVEPQAGLEDGPLQVLFAGRLVQQKDPMLMVEIASTLKELEVDFRFQVVGEGDLKDPLREELESRGLKTKVIIHDVVPTIAPWLAAADVLLLTSAFEGVPYTVYEAMAMGVPVVAPALAGVAEILPSDCGRIVTPRDDVFGYVSALREVADADRRAQLGRNARRRAREQFSIQQMADSHAHLYDELLRDRSLRGGRRNRDKPLPPDQFRCFRSGVRGDPLVSIIVPCFNHGRYLSECIASIQNQTYRSIELVVVDDGSTDPETRELLDELDSLKTFRLIRLASNRGPGAARNAAIDVIKGEYVLPVDADNVLLPHAVQSLVDQLRNAGEQIGFIYPNLQFFGNRQDYFEPPEYNLHQLLTSNYCDTCSLIDRAVFDAGVRYLEKIKVGHEDWDFVLQLAERKVYGQPARAKTLLFRKQGFTRSDVVEHGRDSFYNRIERMHPVLYKNAAVIKARWSPALSIIALTELPEVLEASQLDLQLANQTLTDFELLVRSERDWDQPDDGPNLRRLPARLCSSPAKALEEGLQALRGRHVVVSQGTGSSLLADPTFAEKMLRLLEGSTGADGVALTDTAVDGYHSFQALRPEDEPFEWPPHTIGWRVGQGPTPHEFVTVLSEDPLRDLARAFGSRLQWRHFPLAPRRPRATNAERTTIRARPPRPRRESEAAEARARLNEAPLFSDDKPITIRRLAHDPHWAPPLTLPLVRHYGPDGRRIVSNQRTPPSGFTPEHNLGVVNLFPVQGTAELIATGSGDSTSYSLVSDESPLPSSAATFGHVELAALPLLDPLLLARDPETENLLLVAGDDDPLITKVEVLETLGWIEPYPTRPRPGPEEPFMPGLRGLVRVIDRVERRHRYGIGSIPGGDFVGEIGALERDDFPGAIGAWVTPEGFFVTSGYVPPVHRPPLRSAARWSLAPLRWRGFSKRLARLRAVGRRTFESARRLATITEAPTRTPIGEPHGYLLPMQLEHTIPLYSAHHPVTFDQLLTTNEGQAADMGFVEITLLGHVFTQAPLTGSLGAGRPSVAWASRFGEQIREA
jgi:glycosyltransferase involved in cell wall biosynthesis